MAIPLVDLKAQYLSIKEEIDEAIRRVIDSSAFILGEEVRSFEEEVAAFCGAQHAVGTSSGTSALHLALLACDVGPGSEVITTPFTFVATAEAIAHAGAKPVFVDIDPESYNIDPTKIESAITERAKAIIPVHLYGRPAEMSAILDVAHEYNLKVIEDAAQAHGAEYKSRRVGTFGDVACFSFYPGKNLGAYGDGGTVVTNDDGIAGTVRLLRNHGRRQKYEHLRLGYGYRLDALQAAILRVKLTRLEEWNQRRREKAEMYRELLTGLDLVLPREPAYLKSVCHLFVIRVERRDEVIAFLKERGIQAGIHYPIPLHRQPCLAYLGYGRGDFPEAEKAADEVLSLPIYPELTREQIEAVTRAIRQFLM